MSGWINAGQKRHSDIQENTTATHEVIGGGGVYHGFDAKEGMEERWGG